MNKEKLKYIAIATGLTIILIGAPVAFVLGVVSLIESRQDREIEELKEVKDSGVWGREWTDIEPLIPEE